MEREEFRACMNDLLTANGKCTEENKLELKDKYNSCKDTIKEFDNLAVEISTLARKAKQLLAVAATKETSVKFYMQKTEAGTIAETTETMHTYASKIKELAEAMEEYDAVNQKLKALVDKISPLADKEYNYEQLISLTPTYSIKKCYMNDWENIRVIYYGAFEENYLENANTDSVIVETQNKDDNDFAKLIKTLNEFDKDAADKVKRKKGLFGKKGA